MKLRVVAMMSSLTCLPVSANEATPSDSIIVTASRVAETADETLAPVTVISRDDIEKRQPRSLQDLLHGELGLTIANNGGAGKTTSLFLRGTESDHVLVLIDGVKVGSATSGGAPFESIPVDQIEHIEIVRGPRSSLYGSEAIGGVIQIFTRKGNQQDTYSISAGYGSDSTSTLSITTRGGSNTHWYSVGVNGNNTDGFDACDDDCRTNDPDNDGYKSLSASARLGYRFTNNLEIEGHSLTTNGESEFDGTRSDKAETKNRVTGATMRYTPTERWATTLKIGQSTDHSVNLNKGNFYSRFITTRTTASLQNDIAINQNQLLVIGGDYQNDEVDSSTSYAQTERRNNALFGQLQSHIVHHDVQLSLRYDDNQQFGTNATGSAAWGYTWQSGLKFTTTYSTAFKAPTFNELYYPGYGNDQLKPEEAKNIELGLKGKSSLGKWSLNVFENRVDQLIAYDSSVFAPGNISLARIRGLETALSTTISNWHVDSGITLLDPEHRGNDSKQGNVLPRRAKQTLRLDINRSSGLIDTSLTLVAYGKRYDDLANKRKLGGYATVDLTAAYQLNRDWRVSGRVENVLDKAYQNVYTYNQPDRGLFVSIHYQPQHQ